MATMITAAAALRCRRYGDLGQAAAGCTGRIEAGDTYRAVRLSVPGAPGMMETETTCPRCLDYEHREWLAADCAAGAPGGTALTARVERKRAARLEHMRAALGQRGWTYDDCDGRWHEPGGRSIPAPGGR